MRGEDVLQHVHGKPNGGSPPHARGRRVPLYERMDPERITPACAGKTPERRSVTQEGRDHPRMRGEDGLLILDNEDQPGSPPHARGRPDVTCRNDRLARITPACAGKTSFRAALDRLTRDHPRMRGEDWRYVCPPTWTSGSPPHARGRQLDSPGDPTKPTVSLPVFLHSQPSPLKRFLLWVLGL